MAATKALSTIIAAATSNAAGGTTTGTAVDLTTKYGALVTIKLTNGATGPTVAPKAYVYTSGDNTNYKLFYTIGGDTTASSVNEFAIDIPPSVMYVRVDVKDNTVQPVTCEAFAQVLTAI
jgi:hypothetical protein